MKGELTFHSNSLIQIISHIVWLISSLFRKEAVLFH